MKLQHLKIIQKLVVIVWCIFGSSISSAFSQNSRANSLEGYDAFYLNNQAAVQNYPSAEYCKLKVEEVEGALKKMKLREAFLLKEAANNEALLEQISLHKRTLKAELEHWQNVLVSIEAADKLTIPKSIYDGSLLQDDKKRTALKAHHRQDMNNNSDVYSIQRSDFDALPAAKQKIILDQPERYRIIENK